MAWGRLQQIKKFGIFLRNTDKRFNYFWGGAASGKSWSIAIYLVAVALRQPGVGILCVRKTKPQVRASCLRLIERILMASMQPYTLNKTTMTITVHATGANFYFDGVDDVQKKKSIEGINYLWLEECTEFVKKDFLQMNLRTRADNPHGINRVFVSFNPENEIENAWLKSLIDKANLRGDSQAQHSTYLDNPFLSDEEIAQITNLCEQDAEFDKIYRQGVWATPSNIIYSGWTLCQEMPDEFEERVWGLDFGFALPTGLVELRFVGDTVYEREHIYEAGMTSDDTILRLKGTVENRDEYIVCDCARPEMIRSICEAGFNAVPCRKGPGSVVFGINTVKRHKIVLCEDSPNLIAEKGSYKWKVDAQDRIRDEPVKFNDHLMDAERYGITWVRGLTKPGIEFTDESDEDEDPMEDALENDDLWT